MPPRSMASTVNSNVFTFGGSLDSTPAFAFKGTPTIMGATDDIYPAVHATWNSMQAVGSNDSLSPTNPERHQVPLAAPALSTPSLQHSPSSADNVHTSPSSHSSPESADAAAVIRNKKRKSSEDDELETPSSDKQPPIKKTAHNMIEKRYRTNLNDKIAALRDSVPSLRIISRSSNNSGDNDDDGEDLEGLTPAHKLNKATVLSKATEYIHHLEKRVKRLQEELTECKSRLESYNKLAISGPLRMQNHAATPDGMVYQTDPFGSVPVHNVPVSQAPPQGLIPVPESLASLHRVAHAQQHYAYSQTGAPHQPGYMVPSGSSQQSAQGPQQMVNSRRIMGNGVMGKLMVGSLAGLMILEGLSEREASSDEPNGRGLLSIPSTLFGRSGHLFHSALHNASLERTILAFARLFLVFVAVLYLVLPLLYLPRGPKKTVSPAAIRLASAPSIASPVEVRRKAWLTAIQTVWVPQHNFFLEATALGLKTLKLSMRKLIGFHAFALITGITKEQEEARVKAWEIALDAQLTGGDAEISNSRLLLTLMASGTLPDTPARLMLKALHLRVLLWGYAKSGYGSWYLFEELSAKLARHYWNKAREEHKIIVNSKDAPKGDRLPSHLATLVELDCDEVLVHSIIQRAYNVAWNKARNDSSPADDALDTVVEDFAISSPLDALAAWWSGTTLSRTVISFLGSEKGQPSSDAKKGLDLAFETAPASSGAQLRAMVARAVLVDDERNEHITSSVKALPMQADNRLLTPFVENKPARVLSRKTESNKPTTADMKRSLTVTKCLQLAQEAGETNSSEARTRAITMVNFSDLPGYNLTLLSLVASYKLLVEFSKDDALLAETRQGIERFANCIRVWVGRDTGRRSGISSKVRGTMVEKCLSVSKKLMGIMDHDDDEDAGYVSGSEGPVEEKSDD